MVFDHQRRQWGEFSFYNGKWLVELSSGDSHLSRTVKVDTLSQTKEVVNRFADRQILLKELLRFRILRTHFADWWILKAQCITDFFNISAWIINFVCFKVHIAEIMRAHVNDRHAQTPLVVTFWRSPRMTASKFVFWSNKRVLRLTS